jgi:SnoaL-like domain
VTAALNGLAGVYARRDLVSLFAPGPDNVMYSTGADEKRFGVDEIEAQAERDWAQAESTALTFKWTSVSAAGNAARVAADATFRAKASGQEKPFPSGLLQRIKSAEKSGS